jgi:hypothetical protein
MQNARQITLPVRHTTPTTNATQSASEDPRLIPENQSTTVHRRLRITTVLLPRANTLRHLTLLVHRLPTIRIANGPVLWADISSSKHPPPKISKSRGRLYHPNRFGADAVRHDGGFRSRTWKFSVKHSRFVSDLRSWGIDGVGWSSDFTLCIG